MIEETMLAQLRATLHSAPDEDIRAHRALGYLLSACTPTPGLADWTTEDLAKIAQVITEETS